MTVEYISLGINIQEYRHDKCILLRMAIDMFGNIANSAGLSPISLPFIPT